MNAPAREEGQAYHDGVGGAEVALTEEEVVEVIRSASWPVSGDCVTQSDYARTLIARAILASDWYARLAASAARAEDRCWVACDDDCELGAVHCMADHLPKHKWRGLIHTEECYRVQRQREDKARGEDPRLEKVRALRPSTDVTRLSGKREEREDELGRLAYRRAINDALELFAQADCCPVHEAEDPRLTGMRFRVEVACEGYAHLMDEDVPSDVVDLAAYQQGAADAAQAIRDTLAPVQAQTEKDGR